MMKKLIAAMMVSLMILGMLSGCGKAKGFDGDIFKVASPNMSKEEILKNAEKSFGSIFQMANINKKLVDDPEDAFYMVYRSDYYGYPGGIRLTFDSNGWGKKPFLKAICLSYENLEGDDRQQYEDILSQFSDIYGQPYEDEFGNPMIDVGEWSIKLCYKYWEKDDFSDIYIYFAAKEDFFV